MLHLRERNISTYRAVQLATWRERGLAKRKQLIRAAGRAAALGNLSASNQFMEKARQWERIIILAHHQLHWARQD